MYSAMNDAALPAPGFPIRRSAGQRLFSASPRLIAAVHVLHRLLVPRHPPCALSILTVSSERARKRVRCVHRSRHIGASGANTRFWPLCSFQASPRRGERRTSARGPSKLSSDARSTLGLLPRKEVIQPQLPLRLPCYDFTPIKIGRAHV